LGFFSFFKLKGFTVTYKNHKEFINKYRSSISRDWHDKIEDCILDISKKVFIPSEVLHEWDKTSQARIEFENLLGSTVDLNNKGKEYEKSGDVDKAIFCYEENLKLGYTATFSYERLMVIYRKRKMYHDELRIIELAISIFKTENERRFKLAISNPKNQQYQDRLQLAMEQNIDARNDEGWCILSLYPVLKWIGRRSKVINLIDRLTK
jgi:tetratricopeptide (TPR) repeat protein